MTSDTVAQQRDRQEKGLKRFITYSLAGSFVLHGGFLWLKIRDIWQPAASEPEEITIVVTETPEEPTEVPPEAFAESLDSESTASELPESDSAAPGAATFVEPPPAPQANLQEEEAIAEDEPEPEPTPVPVAEDELENETEPPLTTPPEEVAEADVAEDATENVTETESRNLRNLLEELRQARQQTNQTATSSEANRPTERARNSTSRNTSENGSTDGRGTSPTAVAPNPFGGLSPNRGDAGEGTNRSGESTGESTSDGERSNRGSQSREIRCRGCDFDYPESADGAEGTAQVIVETDEQGQVISVTLSGSSGNPELDRAALEQARERVRLEGAKAGESYPIEVDFVQPGSEAAERVEERGSRNSITVSEPEPEPAPAAESPGTPETAANESPSPEPLSEPATAEPSLSPEAQPSSPDAANSQQPNSEQPSDADTLLNPPANPPTLPEALSPEPVPELAPEPAPEPEAEFIPEPEPAYVPELEPAPIAEPEPAYIPELESAPIAEPDFAPSSSESVE